jgi:DNA helicase-2/ATP-dependent DNA helicase PcrA
LPNVNIIDDDEQFDLMSQCARQLGFEFSKPQIIQLVKETGDSRENLETDNELFKRMQKINDNFYTVSIEYVQRLKRNNVIDFSGLLSEAYEILNKNKDVLSQAQSRWEYIQVDETQDTNLVQFKLVELLVSHTNNILIVGDINQSIYSWRGARPNNINDFIKTYPNVKIIKLIKNYRSTPEIIKVADKLIRHNKNRIESDFLTDNPSGNNVNYFTFKTDKEESDFIAVKILEYVSKGYSFEDIAILYRTNNMSRTLEMSMVGAQIPYTLIGGFSFFDRKEIKDCIAMLRFLINPMDGVSFHRICNKPKRGIGDAAIGKVELYAKNNNCDILKACKSLDLKNNSISEVADKFSFDWKSKSIAECITLLVENLEYRKYLNEDVQTAIERNLNVDELIKDAAKYESEKGNSISGYLENIALMSSYDKKADKNSVSLMTLHASKGLEFPVVFIVGWEHSIMPHSKSVGSLDQIEEERRLAYVGITRAEKELWLTRCEKRLDLNSAQKGRIAYKNSIPSQFLYESEIVKRIYK